MTVTPWVLGRDIGSRGVLSGFAYTQKTFLSYIIFKVIFIRIGIDKRKCKALSQDIITFLKLEIETFD